MSPASTLKKSWLRGQRGWPERFPIVQFPNAPLLAALLASLLAAATTGSVHAYARAAYFTALAAWAWEEMADGANWFRRVLGVAGLIYVVAKVGAALAA